MDEPHPIITNALNERRVIGHALFATRVLPPSFTQAHVADLRNAAFFDRTRFLTGFNYSAAFKLILLFHRVLLMVLRESKDYEQHF